MRRFRILIDLRLLRENMSRAEGRSLRDGEVQRWLLDAGFRPDGDHWVVQEADLGQLEPAEVFAVEDVEEGDG